MTERDLIAEVADAVADRLEGQCVISMDEAIEDAAFQLDLPVEERRSTRLLELIDDKVFCCDGCGWYCSTEELHNMTAQNLCDDCTEEDDDDDSED